MGALGTTVAAFLCANGAPPDVRAQPETFGFAPVESIVSPVDADGEVSWSTADMIIGKGWRPTVYRKEVVEALFGEPTRLAPDVVGWAFAHQEAPDFGVMFVPGRDGAAVPLLWDWGNLPISRRGQGMRLIGRSSSVWLNALAEFQREVLHGREDR